MKAFGLEIRKSGTVSGLYSDVDAVLKAAAIPPMGVSAQMKVGAVAHSLQKMISGQPYFSICAIDDCMKVAHIVVPKERYDIYRACHCIHYNEMLPDFRKNLIAMVLDDFRTILNPLNS